MSEALKKTCLAQYFKAFLFVLNIEDRLLQRGLFVYYASCKQTRLLHKNAQKKMWAWKNFYLTADLWFAFWSYSFQFIKILLVLRDHSNIT